MIWADFMSLVLGTGWFKMQIALTTYKKVYTCHWCWVQGDWKCRLLSTHTTMSTQEMCTEIKKHYKMQIALITYNKVCTWDRHFSIVRNDIVVNNLILGQFLIYSVLMEFMYMYTCSRKIFSHIYINIKIILISSVLIFLHYIATSTLHNVVNVIHSWRYM